jgi:hypothetical protein
VTPQPIPTSQCRPFWRGLALVAALLVSLVLLGLWGLARVYAPALILEGELHHLWAGAVTSRCDLRLHAFPAALGEAEPFSAHWVRGVGVTDGSFETTLPLGLVHTDGHWIEIAARCPALDDTLVVLTPRVALDLQTSDLASVSPSAFLCAAPDGQAHGELAFRSAQFTLYATFRRSP